MNEAANNRDAVGPVPPPGVRVPRRGETVGLPANAASADAAYNPTRPADVGRLPPTGADVGSAPSQSDHSSYAENAGSGDPAYNEPPRLADVGPVPSPGVSVPRPDEPPPRRLRRLHRVWPDRDMNISYLLTMCVDGRTHVLNNEATFERLVAFLLDSPKRYHWFGRRFVVMTDHIHLIANMGHAAIRLGQWIKALKAVVGGLDCRGERPVRAPGLQEQTSRGDVGRLPSAGVPMPSPDAASGDAAYTAPRPSAVGRVPSHGVSATSLGDHEFTRIKRAWRWQDGFHDHKFRSPESESRKWEYVCLNPVRYGLVKRPEEWPFGGEIFYNDAGGPRLVRGTPPLLETGMLIEENDGGTTPREGGETPR